MLQGNTAHAAAGQLAAVQKNVSHNCKATVGGHGCEIKTQLHFVVFVHVCRFSFAVYKLMHLMLVHVNNHDDSRLVPKREEGGGDSVTDMRSNTFRNPSKHWSHLLVIGIKRQAGCGLWFLADAVRSLTTGEINTEQLRSLQGFYILFKYYWSQIWCVIDVQYKQQQL